MKKVNAGMLLGMILSSFCVISMQYTAYAEKTTKQKLIEAQQQNADTKEKLQETQGRIDDLKESRTALSDYLEELNNRLSDISAQLSDLEERMGVKEEDVAAIEAEIDILQKDIDKLAEELLVASEDMVNHYSYMKKRIKHMYMQGDESYIEALLNAGNGGGVLNFPEYLRRVNEYDSNILRQMERRRDEIESKKSVIEEKKFKIEKRMQDKEREQKEIEELRKKALVEQEKVKDLIDETKNDIEGFTDEIESAYEKADSYEQELNKNNQDIKKLQAELDREKALSEKSKAMAKKDRSQVNIVSGERDILACLIFCEAGNEPYEGKVAVGAVVMNRCMSGAFPNTITGVIYQKGQFTPASSGKLAARLLKGASEECYKAADAAMAGANNIGSALFFRRATSRVKGQVIGHHVFYN